MPQVQILSPRYLNKSVKDWILHRLPRAVFYCLDDACAKAVPNDIGFLSAFGTTFQNAY